jgi:hypothetical protein
MADFTETEAAASSPVSMVREGRYLFGAILVWRYAPETRGIRLEELSPVAAADLSHR